MEPTKNPKAARAQELASFKSHLYHLSLTELIDNEDYITSCILWYIRNRKDWEAVGNTRRVAQADRMLLTLRNKARLVKELICEWCDDLGDDV